MVIDKYGDDGYCEVEISISCLTCSTKAATAQRQQLLILLEVLLQTPMQQELRSFDAGAGIMFHNA